jgi:hypothetical protein
LREEIKEFAEEMERIMKENDEDKGDSWRDCSVEFLINKLWEEIEEFKHIVSPHIIYEKDNLPEKELTDIANVCMMLFHRLKIIKGENQMTQNKQTNKEKKLK